jgi:hypothetical protein
VNIYTANTLLTLTAVFTTPAGVSVSPTTVVCKVKDPAGNITAPAVSGSAGSYTAQFTPTLAGPYSYEFIGSGVAVASQVGTFLVNQLTF